MADARRMGKSELFSHFAERFEMKRTQAREFFDALSELAEKELKRSGEFVLPGVVKLVVQKRKARMGRNPATGDWETQDADCDIYWRDKESGERISLAEKAEGLDAIEPCGRDGCGWDHASREDLKPDMLKTFLDIVSITDRESGRRRPAFRGRSRHRRSGGIASCQPDRRPRRRNDGRAERVGPHQRGAGEGL